MSMNTIIAKAWTSTQDRYLVTHGAIDDQWLVFDRLEERIAFRAINEGGCFTAHRACDDFVEVACSQAVVVALREAGYLPV